MVNRKWWRFSMCLVFVWSTFERKHTQQQKIIIQTFQGNKIIFNEAKNHSMLFNSFFQVNRKPIVFYNLTIFETQHLLYNEPCRNPTAKPANILNWMVNVIFRWGRFLNVFQSARWNHNSLPRVINFMDFFVPTSFDSTTRTFG